MHLSHTIEYALRAVMWMAEHPPGPYTARQIADGCRVPASYLGKVLQPLVRRGIISAQRGVGGGYLLQRDLCDLRLLDVVNAVEPIQRFDVCPQGLSSHATLCSLHRVLNRVLSDAERTFGQHTIEQLIQGQTVSESTALRT